MILNDEFSKQGLTPRPIMAIIWHLISLKNTPENPPEFFLIKNDPSPPPLFCKIILHVLQKIRKKYTKNTLRENFWIETDPSSPLFWEIFWQNFPK